MGIMHSIVTWFGYGGNALAERQGQQLPVPGTALVSDTAQVGPDGALQISTVWACVERRATTVASLPFFAYEQIQGQKQLARMSRLYSLLHESPNARMTPLEFWRAMMMNHDLRGNAYARLERDTGGEVIAMWPMPADQVQPIVLDSGAMVYTYRIDNDMAVLSSDNVLHLKGLGNGTVGLAKLEFMRATTDEAAKAQTSASRIFGNGGKPTGVLMIDHVLKPEQREALQTRFAEMATGNISRLYVLEASMKYEQLSLSPEDQQLLETRRFTVEEICRWFDVPPVLVHHSNVTTWGTGVEQIIDGFYKFTIRPMLVAIEQAVRKRVMTPKQRSAMVAEFSLDALLRGNIKDRFEVYAKGVQNGIMTRNEARQLENLPRDDTANELTAQSNLLPLDKLGTQPEASATPEEPVLQSALAQYQAEQRESKAQADADKKHSDFMAVVRTLAAQKPAVTVNVDAPISLPATHIENKMEAPQIPVQIVNQINPTPVEVNVSNEVHPADVALEPVFEVTVEPADVQLQLSLPDRRTDTTVKRDSEGNIVSSTQIETTVGQK